jgi:hypothetical protein
LARTRGRLGFGGGGGTALFLVAGSSSRALGEDADRNAIGFAGGGGGLLTRVSVAGFISVGSLTPSRLTVPFSAHQSFEFLLQTSLLVEAQVDALAHQTYSCLALYDHR